MKILKLLTLISIIFLFPAYSYSSGLGSLRISYMTGDVQIKTEDTDDWVPASINTPLKQGDRLWVPEGSRTELQMIDGTVLRLDQASALDILALDKDASQFYLNEGYVYANFAGRGGLLQIDTPLSSVRAYDNSIFRIDISQDGYTDVWVYKGSIYAEGQEGRTKVDQGNTLSLGERGYAELSPMGPTDEWESWNTERNRRLAERPPSRYLPEELSTYSSDFEQNGRWVTVPEYGPVWTPTVVAAGWAPYRVGRWTWIGGEYVWISYEPWGWVPFHYGRWTFIPSVRSWCWVPPLRRAVFWGPGFVGWVHTPTHVSWVPLAPGEIYYGRGYYGPHSVNITNININTIQVNKIVYKNIHVHNAVTVVHHDTFVRGRHVEVKVRENLFLKERISIGGPAIKPERATLMPVIKEIPDRRRPPVVIQKIKVKEIKERRPLVRERERSVLRPESPPRELPVRPREGRLPDRGRELDRRERKSFERGGGTPPERRIEKEREIKLQDRGSDRPGAGERRIEKGREIKIQEKETGRPGPAEKRIEKEREIKLQDRGSDRPGAGERRIEKEREIKIQEKGSERRIEKEKMEKEKGREKRQRDERGEEKN